MPGTNRMPMLSNTDIERFVEAQNSIDAGYDVALREIRNGRKTSHWIWYIFPQFREFAHSCTADYYGIVDKNEAKHYMEHSLLGPRLREITEALLKHKGKSPVAILGDLDARKVRSCMTMFDYFSPNDIYGEVLDAFYGGERGGRTLRVLNREDDKGSGQ